MAEPSNPSDEQVSSDSHTFSHDDPSPTTTKNKLRCGASTSKFKGVVIQNGHCGAQIYANHQRIWLGTFKSEAEAAMAYDSAAIKLRSGDAYRNFPWTSITVQEPEFQSRYGTEQVLRMIKDGTYRVVFSNFLAVQARLGDYNRAPTRPPSRVTELFQKVLTPSDVGKLNRLVIPKMYAVKYFPNVSDNEEERGGEEGRELVFFDRSRSSWKFRFCYWKSSQSYVFTRGWNRYRKEKGLKANDRVVFSAYTNNEGTFDPESHFIIDVAYSDVRPADEPGVVPAIEDEEGDQEGLELELKLGLPGRTDVQAVLEQEDSRKKGFKLFGVQIF